MSKDNAGKGFNRDINSANLGKDKQQHGQTKNDFGNKQQPNTLQQPKPNKSDWNKGFGQDKNKQK